MGLDIECRVQIAKILSQDVTGLQKYFLKMLQDTCTTAYLHCMSFTHRFQKCPIMVQIAMVI